MNRKPTRADGNCFFHAVNETLLRRDEGNLKRTALVDWMRDNREHDLAIYPFEGLECPTDILQALPPFTPEGLRYTECGRSIGDLILLALCSDKCHASLTSRNDIPKDEKHTLVTQYLDKMERDREWAGQSINPL